MRWTLVRFVGAFVGVVATLMGATAAVITIGQFVGFLPEHSVVTLPSLPFSGNPLWWIALLVAAIAFTVGGILLWARSVRGEVPRIIERDETEVGPPSAW
jgi:hypothetical protein